MNWTDERSWLVPFSGETKIWWFLDNLRGDIVGRLMTGRGDSCGVRPYRRRNDDGNHLNTLTISIQAKHASCT